MDYTGLKAEIHADAIFLGTLGTPSAARLIIDSGNLYRAIADPAVFEDALLFHLLNIVNPEGQHFAGIAVYGYQSDNRYHSTVINVTVEKQTHRIGLTWEQIAAIEQVAFTRPIVDGTAEELALLNSTW